MRLDTPTPIQTRRLLIRLVQETDIADLMEVNGDQEVTRYLPYETWLSKADGMTWFKRMFAIMEGGDAQQFVILDRYSERVMGTCLLFHYNSDNARAELGYVMGRRYWQQGFTLEALSALIQAVFASETLRRLEAEVEPANIASNKLLLKLGFTHEGVMRQRWQGQGSLYDTNIYGLLRHEWIAEKGTAEAPAA